MRGPCWSQGSALRYPPSPAHQSLAPPTTPSIKAYRYTAARHSLSDPAAARPAVAPGVWVPEGAGTVVTPDVPSPLRHTLADPAYASAVRARLS